MQAEPMLRTQEAADLLGVSAATLCKWRVRGGGPRFKKLGRVVVYDPADLREWLEMQSHLSTSDYNPKFLVRWTDEDEDRDSDCDCSLDRWSDERSV